MASNLDFLQTVISDTVKREKVFSNINTLNKAINKKTVLILLINIRSLNKNFHNLEVLIESLKSKPYIVVRTETFILENYEMYELYGYNSHYNHSKLNRN